MHRHRHIVQTSCKKDSNGKHTNDRTILIISFSQYEWTDSVTEVPNKIIINDILTPFIVSSNTHITDVLLKEVLIKEALIKEALTDAPLLIIKENINCSNFLNKDRFNFLTDRVNYKSLTDFPQSIIVVDGRLYGEALFHIFSQNETYSKTYKTDRIMADFVKFLNSSHSDIDREIFKMNFKEVLQRNVYFQDIVSRHNDIPTNPFTKSQLQTNMNKRSSQADMKGKGKALVVQPKEI